MSTAFQSGVHYSNSSTGSLPRLPYHQRRCAIQYLADDGTAGEIGYPINYTELYNLKGRLLTLVDATFTDPEQRKAQKDMVWQTLRSWMEGIEEAAGWSPQLPASEPADQSAT